jgi:hypothetical protein
MELSNTVLLVSLILSSAEEREQIAFFSRRSSVSHPIDRLRCQFCSAHFCETP